MIERLQAVICRAHTSPNRVVGLSYIFHKVFVSGIASGPEQMCGILKTVGRRNEVAGFGSYRADCITKKTCRGQPMRSSFCLA